MKKKRCEMCQDGTHHPTEHLERCDIRKLKQGDVVFVRAVVESVKIHSSTTTISVKHYEPYGGHSWEAPNVNSVDVFPSEDL